MRSRSRIRLLLLAHLVAGRVGVDVTYAIALSQPPPELALMDRSEDEDMVLPSITKIFHTIINGTKGFSLYVLWMEVAISWRKSQ